MPSRSEKCMNDTLQAVADVTVAPDLHGVLVLPRDGNDRQLKHSLSVTCPQVTLKRTAEGFFVDSRQAAGLLSSSTLGWTSEARRFAENRARADKISESLRVRVNAIKEAGSALARKQLAGLLGLEMLDDHQL